MVQQPQRRFATVHGHACGGLSTLLRGSINTAMAKVFTQQDTQGWDQRYVNLRIMGKASDAARVPSL